MKSVQQLGTVVSTDVLVVGGGAAGICAAIKARESHSEVLVTDKGGIGWAGQVPTSGGMIAYFQPERVDGFCKWVAEFTYYLNNQDWTYALAQRLTTAYRELDALGVPFHKKDGEIVPEKFLESMGKGNSMATLDSTKAMMKLRNFAVAMGVKTLDKVYMIDLLRRDGRVVGAIGFGLVDGRTYIFNAKEVILATGNCRFGAEKEFNWTLGEGVAMAYRAGAQLANAEFRNFYMHTLKVLRGKQLMIGPAISYLENASGEMLMDKYRDVVMVGQRPGEPKEDLVLLLYAMMKEVAAGLGPLYLDVNKLPPLMKLEVLSTVLLPGAKRPYSYNSMQILKDKAGIDPEKERVEVEPLCGGGQGPVRIDLDGRTTVDGLWGAGDVAYLGSGWSGSRLHLLGGVGIGFAVVGGFVAGENAGKRAQEGVRAELEYEEVKRVKQRVFAPLGRGGDGDVEDVIYRLHQAVVPMKYCFMRQAGRMKEALGILEDARARLAEVSVADSHELSRYHQAESMILSGELTYQAALLREESRGHHLREDFPDRDDENWLKWIVIEQEDGEPHFSTEPVPLERFKYKPNEVSGG